MDDTSDFLDLIKRNISENVINLFISDDGTALKGSVKKIFPHSKHIFCYIHKKSHLKGIQKRNFERAMFAKNIEDFNAILDSFNKMKEGANELKEL